MYAVSSRNSKIIPYERTANTSRKGRRSSTKNIWEFGQNVFSKSSLSGISQIAESKTWSRRLFWIFLFLACILGFFYHATMYFSLYGAYPTTVDVRVENKGLLEFPGVTLCNNNRLRRSDYCRQYMCSSYDSLQEYEEYWRMNRSDRIVLGHKKESFIANCKLNGRIEMDFKECFKQFHLYHTSERGNCFTFNAKWSSADHKMLYAYESDMWNKPTELFVDVDVESSEYLDEHRTRAALVYLHDPYFYPDFGAETVKARTGHFYSIGIRKTTTKLLPLPYQTNCTVYNAMPWAKRNKGYLTPKMCTQECSRSLQMKTCHCVSSNLTLVFDDSPCFGKKAFCAEDVEKDTMEYCRTLCRVPCVRKTFESTVDSSMWPRKRQVFNVPTWSDRNLTEIRKNLVRIKLYLRTMEHTTYEHQPKYELVEVFSHLGGYLSLWLGFSVLAFCELLEIVTVLVLKLLEVKTADIRATKRRRRRTRSRTPRTESRS